jgi:serine protease Do
MIPWSQGIGFAIAVDTLKSVFDELVETGTVRTPWMGIVGATVNPGIASHYKLPVDKGALLIEVPKGPSRQAGLKAGDVVVSINNQKVNSMEDLRKQVMNAKAGEKVLVRLHRKDDVFEAYVELTSAPG